MITDMITTSIYLDIQFSSFIYFQNIFKLISLVCFFLVCRASWIFFVFCLQNITKRGECDRS